MGYLCLSIAGHTEGLRPSVYSGSDGMCLCLLFEKVLEMCVTFRSPLPFNISYKG